jgi:hypothetical protein
MGTVNSSTFYNSPSREAGTTQIGNLLSKTYLQNGAGPSWNKIASVGNIFSTVEYPPA